MKELLVPSGIEVVRPPLSVKIEGRTLDCPFNFLPPRSVAGWLLSVRPMRAKRSQAKPGL